MAMQVNHQKETILMYMDALSRKCVVPKAKKQVCAPKGAMLPSLTCASLAHVNYTREHLKQWARFYGLKLSGNKADLEKRLYLHLRWTQCATRIQAIFRGYLVKKYIAVHGPAGKNRTLCNNTDDFVTMDALSEIPFHQFISYTDEDGFVYGFHIASLQDMCLKTTTELRNPYTRKLLPNDLFKHIRYLMRVSKLLGISLCLTHEAPKFITQAQYETNVAVTLFQQINALGHYSDVQWFLSLNAEQTRNFLVELHDIWDYRAGLTDDMRREICDPDPFWHIPGIHFVDSLNELRSFANKTIHALINSASSRENRSLGAYYVLSSLTLVSPEAATALPWLFEAVQE